MDPVQRAIGTPLDDPDLPLVGEAEEEVVEEQVEAGVDVPVDRGEAFCGHEGRRAARHDPFPDLEGRQSGSEEVDIVPPAGLN